MRPSHPAPNAAPLTRKDLVPLNGRPNDALSDVRTAPTPRRRHPAPRIEPGPGSEQKTIRHAEARSSEGEVHFFLQRIAGGLYVEREETPRRGTRTSQRLHLGAGWSKPVKRRIRPDRWSMVRHRNVQCRFPPRQSRVNRRSRLEARITLVDFVKLCVDSHRIAPVDRGEVRNPRLS